MKAAAALTIALTASGATAPPPSYAALAVTSFTAGAETASVALLSSSGVRALLPRQTFAPGLGPCTVAFDGGAYLMPSGLDGTALLRLNATTGALDNNTVTLNPPFLIATLTPGGNGLLYAIGQPPTGSPFLELVSVNASSGAVTAVSPILTDNVEVGVRRARRQLSAWCARGRLVDASARDALLVHQHRWSAACDEPLPNPSSPTPSLAQECMSVIDMQSQILVYAWTGPLQLPIISGMPISSSGAGGFSVAMNCSALALATMPAAVAGGSPLVLFIAEDQPGVGSIGGLQLLDPDAGVSRMLISVEDIYTSVSQGSLVYDAASNTAAALAKVVHADGTPDVLIEFNLSGLSYTATVLADAQPAQGLWALGIVK